MKKIKLSEGSYDKLKEKLVNEISYGTVDRAYNRSDDLFYDVYTSFEDFYMALDDAMFNAKHESREGEQTSNPYLEKVREYADIIRDILYKKKLQGERFSNATSSVDFDKFWRSKDSRKNDIDDMDLTYLQRKYPK